MGVPPRSRRRQIITVTIPVAVAVVVALATIMRTFGFIIITVNGYPRHSSCDSGSLLLARAAPAVAPAVAVAVATKTFFFHDIHLLTCLLTCLLRGGEIYRKMLLASTICCCCFELSPLFVGVFLYGSAAYGRLLHGARVL